MTFVKGKSGNPAGRPKGSRSKLADAFYADLLRAWEGAGEAALARVAADDPSTFVRVAASLMPKEAELTIRNIVATELADDELAHIATRGSEGASEATEHSTLTH